MKEIEIRLVERLGGVPLYRLTVDGAAVLRRAPMRRVIDALAAMQTREETSSGAARHLPPEGEGRQEAAI